MILAVVEERPRIVGLVPSLNGSADDGIFGPCLRRHESPTASGTRRTDVARTVRKRVARFQAVGADGLRAGAVRLPLGPCAVEMLAARPVSTVVNNPHNDDPRCLESPPAP